MSVLIRGMETPMPGDMIVCALIDGKTQCTLATRHRPVKWCEVVEVPTPHGDLIDRDHLLDILDKIILKPDSYAQRCMAMATKEILIYQTPVIKAEDET